MRIKFFQSSSSTSSNKGGGGSTALDDASFISSSSGTSQSSWHQQQQRASTEPRRGKSPYYSQESQQQQNRPKTLNTVMQLFDHDSQSLKRNLSNNNSSNSTSIQNDNNVSSIDNPYRIKANGAVVINRTTHTMTDSDDLLLHGTNSTGLSSHISTTSSFETNSVITTTNPSISQPITTAPFFEPEDTIQHTTSTSSSGGSSSSSSRRRRNENTDNKEKNSTRLSSTPKSIHPSTKQQQSTKMRMESNSSRSTFPIHDTTRFSTDGDSICSVESWTSSMIMEPLEEDNNTHYSPNEQNHHHHHHHHHVTALSPPPRNTTKKWERGRIYSNEIDDICEALTTMNENPGQHEHSLLSPPLSIPPTSSSSSALQQQQQPQDESFNNWHTMFELVNQENIRLRHQLQREQKERDENYKHQTEILVNTRRENKYLKSTLSRIEMLSHTDVAYNKEKKRRQSTGEITLLFPPLGEEKENENEKTTTSNEKGKEEAVMALSNRRFQGSSVTLTYERKIKILLDEIEGMQAEEEMMYTRRSKLATKNNMLERHLLAREETVKQLEHDLRIMRLQM
ncbi:hypothetical protein BDC45DRAFT_526085 [Circinella umbellata]|nr:hypothetical protein BDC45DRAFT_526085 [Circinella umbellata]